MFAFWNFILLDKAGYTGNVFDKHADLKFNEIHFDHWLYISRACCTIFLKEKKLLLPNNAPKF